jgi:hypothetical protein
MMGLATPARVTTTFAAYLTIDVDRRAEGNWGMTTSGNPFTEQTLGKYFVGREEELDTFRRGLAGLQEHSPSHAFVAGLHGTGKTFFLDKLVDIARAADSVGAFTTIDTDASAHAAIVKILRAVAVAVDQASSEGSGSLATDWDRGPQSTFFRQPKQSEPDSDAILDDLRKLAREAREHGRKGILVCIDEGQRLRPAALSALKNACQRENSVQLVLSLRLTTADGGPRKAGRVLLENLASDAEGDYGASRIFVTEYGMGPFATEDEARKCITRRLEDGPVQFSPDVLTGIVHVANSVPSAIIHYAGKVWEKAASLVPPLADKELFAAVMREEHATEMTSAYALVSEMSGQKRAVLGALLAFRGRAAIDEIVNRLAPAGADDMERWTRQTVDELSDLTRDVPSITVADGRFAIARPIDAFALRWALTKQQ